MIGMGWRGNNVRRPAAPRRRGQGGRVGQGQGPGAGHGTPATVHGHHPRRRAPHHQGHAAGVDARQRRAVPRPARADRERPPAGDRLLRQGEGRHRRHEPMIWTVTTARAASSTRRWATTSTRCSASASSATLQRGTEWAATGGHPADPEELPDRGQGEAVPD